MLTSTTNNNIAFNSSFYERFFKKISNKDVGNFAKYNKFGHALASPHWNRSIIGATAILCQPTMDYFNKKVDRETATVSAIRTASKIVCCTAVGFVVRGGCYKLTEKFCHGSKEEGSTLLTPQNILKLTNAEIKNKALKLHKNAFSTVSALCVMVFTNFLLDAPLTTFVSNKIITKYKEKSSQKNEVNNG